MPTDKEIDIAAHVLYDQESNRVGVRPSIPLLALGPEYAVIVDGYKARAREILVAAERVREAP